VGLVRTPNPSSPSASTVQWPMFTSEMPWAERVEEISPAGTVVLVDNHELIDRLLKQSNDMLGWVSQGLDGGFGGAGGTVTTGSFTTGGTGGALGTGAGGARPDAGAEAGLGPGNGCGCSVPGRSASTRPAALLLA